MNTITLNGVSSSTIQGLLIQELPPISKPEIRTQTEEIDGRDGDIVTRLGYSAYDKEIKIGLTYGYDVDDVIAFFDSQGIVTFSNEPDKYYNYQINEQIDFERLIRFKQAKVKFHVQPFKYKVDEEPVTYTQETETISGNIVTFDGTAGTSIKSLVAQIVPIQEGSGDPSPTNVRPISGWSGVNVEQRGKNLLSNYGNNLPYSSLGVTVTGIDGKYTLVVNNASGYPFARICTLKGLKKGAYRLKSNFPNRPLRIMNRNVTPPVQIGDESTWFNIPTDITDDLYVELAFTASQLTNGTYEITAQLETGDSATEFEPYQGSSYSIPFKDENGDPITVYGGNMNITDGEGIDGMKVIKLRDLSWTAQSALSRFYSSSLVNEILKPIDEYTIPQGLACECYKPDIQNNLSIANNAVIVGTSGNIFIKDTNYTDVNSLINAVGDYLLLYPLATPTPIYCEPTEIKTIEGVNNIWADTGDVSVGIVKADLTAVNEGNIFAKPTLYIEGSGTVGVSVNGEEALSIDMSEIPHITIDVPEMNAYYDTELANRKVTGDPDDLFLDIGTDTISFTGNVTKAELTEYSRWI